MTSIKYRTKPIWHVTGLHERGRAILVAETPVNLLLRLKGKRQVLKVPWSICYLKAAGLEANRIKQEKLAAKKQKREAKAKSRGHVS